MTKKRINVRNKGLSFERDTVNYWKDVFPKAERAMVGSSYDNAGCDIRNMGNFTVQCKRYAKYVNPSVLHTISPMGAIPIVVTKADRQEPLIIIKQSDFKEIIKDIGHAYWSDYPPKEEEKPIFHHGV